MTRLICPLMREPVFTFDQSTKLIPLAALSRGNVEPVLQFFDLRLSFKLGMFAQVFAGRPLALAAITLVIVGLPALLLVLTDTRWEADTFGLIPRSWKHA